MRKRSGVVKVFAPRKAVPSLFCLIAMIYGGHVTPVHAELYTLYDGAAQAVVPDEYSPQWLAYQSWELFSTSPPIPVPGPVQQYHVPSESTSVNSSGSFTSNGAQVGHSNYALSLSTLSLQPVNPDFPLLDRHAGYKIGFSVEILSASTSRPERAGFSILAVGGDVADSVASSIEIGFQQDRIFAQNDDFTGFAVENTSFNPVGIGFVDYELTVLEDSFRLTADGSEVLQGALHDHFGEYVPPFGTSPYELPNLIFLGDDTTSAVASYRLGSVRVTTVPEPSSLALLGLGLLGAAFYGVRRKRTGDATA